MTWNGLIISALHLLKPFFQLELSGTCSPYKVQEVEGSGRGLVATRDIAQNEHILTAFPAAFGPCSRYGETLYSTVLIYSQPGPACSA